MPTPSPSGSAAARARRWVRIARLPPALPGLSAQLFALAAAAAIAAALAASDLQWQPSPLQRALLQGVIAAAVGRALGMADWWLPIHVAFAPALVAVLSLGLSPLWFLGAFLLLAAVYGRTHRTQVPLYPSSRAAAGALAALLPPRSGFAFIDLGSGCGGLLRRLYETRPDGRYHGVEAAPLPYLIGKWRNALALGDCRITWGDFWKHDLAPYDVVYAYLSPRPMAALWRKARREMRPGSLFVSNTFGIPGIAADRALELGDAAGSTLYVWRIAGRPDERPRRRLNFPGECAVNSRERLPGSAPATVAD